MRFQLLDYCYGVSQRRENPDADVMITAVSENERCEPFDSLFEQRVFNRVVDRGYSVIPQFSTDSYRIDMVIVGARARLAVECDGDRWHGPAQYADDLARQRDLERAGWHFFRIRESAFYLDRAGTMRDLWKMLDSLDIYPSDRQPTVTPSAESIGIAAVGDHLAEISEPAESTVDQTQVEPVYSGSHSTDAVPERLEAPAEDSATQTLAALSEHEEPRASDPLPAYRVFWGELPHPAESPSAVVARSLIDIVAVEGPVARSRLFTAYIRSSEIERGGRVIVNHLAQALGRAVRSGHIVAEGRGLNITYRLPDQPTVRRRQLGPRLLSEVPTTELAALLADATEAGGGDDPDQLFREALSRLGMHRLTTDAKRILDAAFAVALASGAREADGALTPAGDESRNDPPRIDTVRPA
jgi:very-short-patch-repair endonuclease